ncbi:uncharacterized protein BJ212DRAFT_1590781 [Suillus subaureus]|uniref:Uncharacterized protein n=1 Tax=Suillus subaureus TaxID=48587 RepID=A0A9P7DXB2_9AGAM|nr:uncharacterized protein BJ212DRAFT_1590781 [Suillus subaureus]KAG1805560.1 hypothetical protein BJ212DRAFT_1590781 [Suillus subaureus]
MPRIIRLGPNVTLKLMPPSPDSCCDTCKLTDKSPLKIVIPSLSQRLANLKRKQLSSSSESSDSGLPTVKKLRRRTKKLGDKPDTSRLTIKTRPLQRQNPTAVDDKDESDDGNAPDDEAEEEEEESQNPAEANQAVSNASRLRNKIRLPRRQTDTAKDDNTSGGKPQEKEEDEDSYREASSSESSDEEEDEYIPPRKRQRKCLQSISNRLSSRTRTSTSTSAAKHSDGV